jgi:hypothetical protein
MLNTGFPTNLKVGTLTSQAHWDDTLCQIGSRRRSTGSRNPTALQALLRIRIIEGAPSTEPAVLPGRALLLHPPLATAVLNKTDKQCRRPRFHLRHRPRKNPNTGRASPSVPSLTFRSAEGSRSCEENASHARAGSHCAVNEVGQGKNTARYWSASQTAKAPKPLHFWLKKWHF